MFYVYNALVELIYIRDEVFEFEQDMNPRNHGSRCHDPNPGFMTGNVGAVSKGHLTYAKPQNGHIKRTISPKIRSGS